LPKKLSIRRRGGRRNLRSPKMRGSGIPLRVLIEKAQIMDHVYTYFSENLDSVTKEEILEALKNALGSAHCWREACLFGSLSIEYRSEGK
jgi:hypothetical protein